MIAQCPQCQSRFRVPDEKVSERGVKLRCTRCAHLFHVDRPADGALTPPPLAPQDPFAAFSQLAAPPDEDATRAGVDINALALTRDEVPETTRVMPPEVVAQLCDTSANPDAGALPKVVPEVPAMDVTRGGADDLLDVPWPSPAAPRVPQARRAEVRPFPQPQPPVAPPREAPKRGKLLLGLVLLAIVGALVLARVIS